VPPALRESSIRSTGNGSELQSYSLARELDEEMHPRDYTEEQSLVLAFWLLASNLDA